MNFLSTLGLIALSLVGYSAGATLAGRSQKLSPTLLDLGTIAGIWTTAVLLRGVVGRWLSILVWLMVAGVVSSSLTALRRTHGSRSENPTPLPAPIEANIFAVAWRVWKAFALDMGNYQGRALMAFFYFAVVTPFGVLMRLSDDSAAFSAAPDGSFWVPREAAETSIEAARRQS